MSGSPLHDLVPTSSPVGVIGLHYHVAIRDNLTQEVRTAVIPFPWGPASTEWWLEGAMACDCGRAEYFASADPDEAADPADDHERACTSGRYTVLYADLANGQRVALEEPLVLH